MRPEHVDARPRTGTVSQPTDYYELLGIPRDAEPQAIKQAFRARARQLHPDVSDDPDAKERFAELSKAYKVLSRPTARLLYDRVGYRGRGNGGFDVIAASRAQEARGGLSTLFDVGEIAVDFLEAVRGTRRHVAITTVGACTACRGTGALSGTSAVDCAACEGTGRVRETSDLGDARLLQLVTCAACAGKGRIVGDPCPECEGSGRAKAERRVKITIPPGAEDGRMIPADSDDGGDSGGRGRDVYVVLRVRPNRDSRLVRYAAGAALAFAVALFIVLAVAPEAIAA